MALLFDILARSVVAERDPSVGLSDISRPSGGACRPVRHGRNSVTNGVPSPATLLQHALAALRAALIASRASLKARLCSQQLAVGPLPGSWAYRCQGQQEHAHFDCHRPVRVASCLPRARPAVSLECQLPGSLVFVCQDSHDLFS